MVVSKEKLAKAIVKADGNVAKAAKTVGITRTSAYTRLKRNPELKTAILNVREEALKKSGLSRAFVYRGIKQGCQANVVVIQDGKAKKTKVADHDARHKYLKTALELHKDLDPDKEQSVQNIGSVIFNLIHNTNRQVIEVV